MNETNSDIKEVPDGDLFLEDTEAWYRKRHPDWSEEAIKLAWRDVRFSSLLEFYEEATKLYPDLEARLPLLPTKPYRGYFSSPSQPMDNGRQEGQ